MSRSGTLIVCLHNLDCSGANQVILNIVQGTVHAGNVVILSPRAGPMSKRLIDCGASVRVGVLEELLLHIRDAFLVICNSLMTADIVVSVAASCHPVIWIVHEWWTNEMISQQFALRNLIGYDLGLVKKAMCVASHVVFVCKRQQDLYCPSAPSSVIHVGVPKHGRAMTTPCLPVSSVAVSADSDKSAETDSATTPALSTSGGKGTVESIASACTAEEEDNFCGLNDAPVPNSIPVPASISASTMSMPTISKPSSATTTTSANDLAAAVSPSSTTIASSSPPIPMQQQPPVVVFLVLGIVCPRKNQIWAVELFKQLKRTLFATVDGTSGSAAYPSVRLQIVGARYERSYEINYLDELALAIGEDPDISLYPVTDNVYSHLAQADVLLFPSLNEVSSFLVLSILQSVIRPLGICNQLIGELNLL